MIIHTPIFHAVNENKARCCACTVTYCTVSHAGSLTPQSHNRSLPHPFHSWFSPQLSLITPDVPSVQGFSHPRPQMKNNNQKQVCCSPPPPPYPRTPPLPHSLHPIPASPLHYAGILRCFCHPLTSTQSATQCT